MKELFKEPVLKAIFWEERSIPDDVFLERLYGLASEKYDKDKEIVKEIFSDVGFRTWVLNRYHTTPDEEELTMMCLTVSIKNEIVREIGLHKAQNDREEKHDAENQKNTIGLDESAVLLNTSYATLNLGENPHRFDTLYVDAETYHIVYVSVGGKRYLLSDLIEAYDAVGKKKCRIRKGRGK